MLKKRDECVIISNYSFFVFLVRKKVVSKTDLSDLLGKDLEQELVQDMVAVQEQGMVADMVEEQEHS